MMVETAEPAGAQIAALVFDLDGTIYRSGPVRRAMLWRLLRAGVSRPSITWREARLVYYYRRAQEHLRRSPEPLGSAQLRLCCEWSGMSEDEAEAAIAHWMEDAPSDLVAQHIRPGMMDLLEAAASRNLCLGLLSDYPAEKKLRAMGLAGRFSAVLSAKDPRVGLFKPSPRGIQVMLQDLGVGPESAVYVGDRPSVDGEAARRAGVKCVILGRRQGRKGRGWIGVPDVPALRAWLRI